MSNNSIELKNKFSNWCLRIQFYFFENNLFQPIGLDLSCVSLNLETLEDYSFKGIENSDLDDDAFPLAYYRADTDAIHIFIEHEAFNKRETDEEKQAFLMFILFHEANHRLLMHDKRLGDKDAQLWNIAADMEIHNMFYVYNEIMKSDKTYSNSKIYKYSINYIEKFLFDKTDKNKSEGLFDKSFLQNTAEEIYVILQKSKKIDSKSYNASDEEFTATAEETTYELPNGKTIKTSNVQMPTGTEKTDYEKESNKENSRLTRKTLMENSIQQKIEEMSKRGLDSSPCKTFLQKLFKIKVDWKKILRNSLHTALEKSEYFSWAKPRTSLFAMPHPLYLPAQIEDDNRYGTVIIARDESGSMTNEECQKAAGIILESKEYYKKLVIIKHDVKITSVNEITEIDNKAEEILLTRNSYGGTSHKEVFEFIKNYSINNKEKERISCCIFITDMGSDIKETQNIISDYIPRIYLTNSDGKRYHDKSVKGQIIEIEL